MPKALEEKLKREAAKLGAEGKLKKRGKYKNLAQAENAYVYGTMRKTGWRPSR